MADSAGPAEERIQVAHPVQREDEVSMPLQAVRAARRASAQPVAVVRQASKRRHRQAAQVDLLREQAAQ